MEPRKLFILTGFQFFEPRIGLFHRQMQAVALIGLPSAQRVLLEALADLLAPLMAPYS